MLTPLLALALLQTTGRKYYPTLLDSVPLTTRSYVRVTGKAVSVARLASGTVRVVLHAGDAALTIDCVPRVSFCPPLAPGQVLVVFGRRYKSSVVGWEVRPVEGVHIATPGAFTSCVVGGVRRRCWLGAQDYDDAGP